MKKSHRELHALSISVCNSQLLFLQYKNRCPFRLKRSNCNSAFVILVGKYLKLSNDATYYTSVTSAKGFVSELSCYEFSYVDLMC